MSRKVATVQNVERMLDIKYPISFVDMDEDRTDFVLLDPEDIEVLKLSSESEISIVVYDKFHPFRTKIKYVDQKINLMITDDDTSYVLEPGTGNGKG